MLSDKKFVVVLHYIENKQHLIACETLTECKTLLENAKVRNEATFVMQLMGMDTLVITNFVWQPLDIEIVKQLIRSYIGLMGYQAHHLYVENTLLSALDE